MTVKDAWGLPAARITLTPHDNDLKQGRFLIDRAADILEAAGSKKVQKVYAQRVTGNCSHQHGTLRMGMDPATSVLDKYCRAHEVGNLYAVDGSPFPTATGANPTLTIMANAWRVADRIAENRGAIPRPRAKGPPEEQWLQYSTTLRDRLSENLELRYYPPPTSDDEIRGHALPETPPPHFEPAAGEAGEPVVGRARAAAADRRGCALKVENDRRPRAVS